MNYIIFSEEITSNSIQLLIDRIVDKDDDVIIYLNSEGGSHIDSMNFVDFTKKFAHNITIMATFQTSSAAFDLFFFSKSKKIIGPSAYGLAHLANREINTTDIKNPSDIDKFLLEDIEKTNKARATSYRKIGFNKDMMDRYNKGEDIFVSNRLMKRYAKTAERLVFKTTGIKS
jgi:ATP-dependent protease ClpP protease subunit